MKKNKDKHAGKRASALKRMVLAILLVALMLGMAPVLAYEEQPGDPYSGMRDEYVIQAGRGANGGQRGAGADGRTARYIVKYREGKAASFESMIASRLEAAISLAEPMIDTETGKQQQLFRV